jgi:hypothetical protein
MKETKDNVFIERKTRLLANKTPVIIEVENINHVGNYALLRDFYQCSMKVNIHQIKLKGTRLGVWWPLLSVKRNRDDIGGGLNDYTGLSGGKKLLSIPAAECCR